MKRPTSAGGWPAILYTLRMSRKAGGLLRMWRSLRSRNACKTCALGMGGQLGGMVNERGRFPEVCKKSVQAMAADMQGRVREGFFEEFDFDKLARFTPRQLESSGRLTEPLYAAPGARSYQAISWERAIALVAQRMRATDPDRSFFYFSGRSSNEAGFLLQLFARLYGTNNVNNCSYFCHQASGVGLSSVTGSGMATIELEDLDACDLVFLIGGNPASNHPRLMRSLIDLKRRGGRVIVINPMREIGLVNFRVPSDLRSMLMGSMIADLYTQPHIGGDIALLTGVAKAVIESGAQNEAFLKSHTESWDALRQHITSCSWDAIQSASGVSVAETREIAAMYAQSERTIFAWTMGITHHEHGVGNVQMIANLALLRGMVGRSGSGLLPLRGHSNVQGIGSMGVTPALRDEVCRAIEGRFGVQLPRSPGLDTLGCVQRAHEGSMDLALHLGGNLFGSCPDASYAREALGRIGMCVFLSTTLNTGHIHGRGRESLILPVLARDEEPRATTQESMFNYVRLSDGGKPRHPGMRSEVQVISALARNALGEACPLDFHALERHGDIRAAISAIIPGYEAVGDIDRTRREFHITGRVFHEPRFATPTGKARLHVVKLPSHDPLDSISLRLMTVRSEGQFNTVVYEESDSYRGQERRDVILMHRDDIERMGLSVDQRVTVRSSAGEMRDILVREMDIHAGNAAMYYPEANVLVPRVADAMSRTPAFKHVIVRIGRQSGLPVLTT